MRSSLSAHLPAQRPIGAAAACLVSLVLVGLWLVIGALAAMAVA